jgi:hypothetical protein
MRAIPGRFNKRYFFRVICFGRGPRGKLRFDATVPISLRILRRNSGFCRTLITSFGRCFALEPFGNDLRDRNNYGCYRLSPETSSRQSNCAMGLGVDGAGSRGSLELGLPDFLFTALTQ